MRTKLFLNLPVADLDRSVAFFTALGFEFNPQFTDEHATCMILSDEAFVMLLAKEFFQTFTPKDIADTRASTEAIMAISVDSKEAVDELVNTALKAGGVRYKDPDDHEDYMYGWGFQDPDGHLWEVIWMDEGNFQ